MVRVAEESGRKHGGGPEAEATAQRVLQVSACAEFLAQRYQQKDEAVNRGPAQGVAAVERDRAEAVDADSAHCAQQRRDRREAEAHPLPTGVAVASVGGRSQSLN